MRDSSLEAVHEEVRVLGVTPSATDMFVLRLEAPAVCQKARPGQFVMLGPIGRENQDPFLNRPLSIHRVVGGELHLLVAMVGRGTRLLRGLPPGETIGLLGPIGRGFQVRPGARPIFLVGGGLGIAPLVFLAEWLTARGEEAILIYGAPSADRLASTEAIQRGGAQVYLATDDGSLGFHGNAVELLAARFQGLAAVDLGSAQVEACGPEAMMRAAVALAQSKGVKAIEVSLESHMACGRGACLGCTVFMLDGRGRRICVDGPVFDGLEVFPV